MNFRSFGRPLCRRGSRGSKRTDPDSPRVLRHRRQTLGVASPRRGEEGLQRFQRSAGSRWASAVYVNVLERGVDAGVAQARADVAPQGRGPRRLKGRFGQTPAHTRGLSPSRGQGRHETGAGSCCPRPRALLPCAPRRMEGDECLFSSSYVADRARTERRLGPFGPRRAS